MKVVLAGSTGMIGRLILKNCLASKLISEIILLVRKPTNTSQDKRVKEIVIEDFENYSEHYTIFQNVKAAFFCIGAYTGQVADDLFRKITVDYAIAFANALKRGSENAVLCFLSGAGADRSEKSRTAFARYKGIAENQISALGMEFYTFRPGYIYPVTPRQEPNLMYSFSRFIYPLIKLFGKGMSIKSTELAASMFYAGLNGAEKEILENKDILDIYESMS